MTHGLIRRGNLDTDMQKEDKEETQGEDSHLQAKEKGPERALPYQEPALQIP